MCKVGQEVMKLFRYLIGPDSDDRARKSFRAMRMGENKEKQCNFL